MVPFYSINRSVFVMETQCDYCAVRTEVLNVIYITFKLQGVKRIQSTQKRLDEPQVSINITST
jgi:hypothetical protein